MIDRVDDKMGMDPVYKRIGRDQRHIIDIMAKKGCWINVYIYDADWMSNINVLMDKDGNELRRIEKDLLLSLINRGLFACSSSRPSISCTVLTYKLKDVVLLKFS